MGTGGYSSSSSSSASNKTSVSVGFGNVSFGAQPAAAVLSVGSGSSPWLWVAAGIAALFFLRK